jgi:hypothetical protein
MENFDDFLIQTNARLKSEQELFMAKFNIGRYDSWYYDQPSGVFTFSNDIEKLFFKFQSIGTFSKKSNTWLWSWANNNTYPNVRIDSEKIKDFGHKNNYLKLIESKWDADEIDGWEMLSIASWILKPIGVYRIPTESLLMYVIITEQIDENEANLLKENSKQLVDCGSHGLRRQAFICQHLDLKTRKGFNEAFETWKGMELEIDDDFQAWCDDCEKIRIKYDGWNDESMKYAKIKLICENCYFDMKRINK